MTFIVNNISSNAFPQEAPIFATASTIVQPKSCAPRKDLCQKKSLFRDWFTQFLGSGILSAHQGAVIFLVKATCFYFAVTVGNICIGSPTMSIKTSLLSLILCRVLLSSFSSNVQKRWFLVPRIPSLQGIAYSC